MAFGKTSLSLIFLSFHEIFSISWRRSFLKKLNEKVIPRRKPFHDLVSDIFKELAILTHFLGKKKILKQFLEEEKIYFHIKMMIVQCMGVLGLNNF